MSSFTKTYVYDMTEDITSVKVDGVAMTERASASDCETLPGSWFHDVANGKLYVSASTGSVFDKTVIAIASMKFATKAKRFADEFYDPRVENLPTLSMRIEARFGGVGQLGGGSLSLINEDGFFDSRNDYLWGNADSKATLKLGFDPAESGQEMAFSNYSTVGVWAIEAWEFGDRSARFQLAEPKTHLKTLVPFERYDKDTYSSLDDDDVGLPIQRAYGQIYGARPVLINSGTKTFKVANHAIKSLDAIRLLIDEVWTTSSFTTTDLDNGEFTCSGWQDGYEVSVDFKGRKNADETLMDNAADVVEDLLLYAGIPAADIDSAQLTESFNRLDIGAHGSAGDRLTYMALSLYLNESRELTDILDEINMLVGSFIFIDAEGKYHFEVFEPTPSEDLDTYDEKDTLDFVPIVDARPDELVSKVFARYAARRMDEWWSLTSFEDTGNQYQHGVIAAAVVDADLLGLSAAGDALSWAERHVRGAGKELKRWKVTLPSKGLEIAVGDQFLLENSRRGFSRVVEVLETSINLNKATISLVVGNLREYGATAGFWVADSPTFPTRLGGGSCAAWDSTWTADQKKWAKENIGFWTDDNGFADPDDPESYIISTWF